MTAFALARTSSPRRLGVYLGILLILLCLLLATIPQITAFGELTFFFVGLASTTLGLQSRWGAQETVWVSHPSRPYERVVAEETPFFGGACAGAAAAFWIIALLFLVWG